MSKLSTMSTLGMSRPLDATSVATKMFLCPDLNLFNAPNLFGCDSWPWRHTALNPKFLRSRVIRSALLQVATKIIVDCPLNSSRRYAR
jgi:hypothetical protein